MIKQISIKDSDRKKEILEAALYCFLNFGFTKTSMDDVAKKAKLSRPLIYLKFKNKEDLLLGLYEEILGKSLEDSESILDSKMSKKEKLLSLIDIMVIKPWDRISGHPRSQEFYETCDHSDPKTFLKYEKQKLRMITEILENKPLAEVFSFAIEGLMTDLPSTANLKKRVAILVDRFVD